MKKIANMTWALLLALIVVSCSTDLTPLNKRIEELEGRVTKLEALTQSANSTIEALQGLIAAEQGRTYVTGYKATDYGYDLSMSDGTTISLKNGRNGKTPAIGVTEMNGSLYWTIDGEPMRDADGNPIKAKAQDGKAGATPQMRIDSEGYWMVSTDGGKTWTHVRDEKNQKVRAKGLDATDTLKITETDAAIVIAFGGKTYTISKTAGGGSGTPGVFDPKKMAIEYVSEFGVAEDGKSFATTHEQPLGFYNLDKAQELFAQGFLLGYHLPTNAEWLGIFPSQNSKVEFNKKSEPEEMEETILVGKGETEKKYKAHYMSLGEKVIYGIKFEDKTNNDKRTAYRYELVSVSGAGQKGSLKVTARLIGTDESIDIKKIADENWWKANNANDKTRIFPLSGQKSSEKTKEVGEKGYYWSGSNGSGRLYKGFVYVVEISNSSAKMSLSYSAKYQFAVRPFSNF